jgi:hypothetical protein
MICDLCLRLEITAEFGVVHVGEWTSTYHDYPHYENCIELERSAEGGCRVCQFFLQELLRSAGLQRASSLPSGRITVTTWFLHDGSIGHIRIGIENSPSEVGLEPFILPCTSHPNQTAEVGTANILGRHISQDPGSHQSFAWIEKLMHECCSSTSSHPHCPKQSSWDTPLPDRVLDLEASSEDGDLRLQTNERSDLLGKYIALSHCWGQGPRPLETTTKNISSHTNRIKFSDLSRSFQDAVRICRRLSVRYLWLDTLCILQDSRDDWAQQASKMASVYENAFLTLAFSGARNTEQAILSPRPPLPSVRLGGSLAHVHLRTSRDEHPDMEDGSFVRSNFESITHLYAPLGRRAWAYQESLLSPRVLYFTSCQLAWKCQQGAFVESSIKPHGFRQNFGSCLMSIPGKSANCIDEWQAAVEHFSSLSITVASDKLVAFSGIAKRFATLLQDEYIAGLWKSLLPELLLWRINDSPKDRYVRPLAYRAPSWSWAAIDGPIKYSMTSGDDLNSHCRDMRLIDIAVESATSDVFGAIKGAQIHVHGFCAEVAPKYSGGKNRLRIYWSSAPVEGVAIPVMFFPDIVAEFGPEGLYPPETKFMCLQINRRHDKRWETILGESTTQALALKEVGEGSGVFRRVGYVQFSDYDGDREEWVERDLILI